MNVWQDIIITVLQHNATQLPIRAIHAQPHPIRHILCVTRERVQIAELVACPDVGICLDRSNVCCLVLIFEVGLIYWT